MAGKNERYAEELVKKEMKMELGINSFENVYVQGEKCAVSAINAALKKAGGKPKNCELFDYTTKGTSKKMLCQNLS